MPPEVGPCVLLISQEQRLLDALDAAFRARWPDAAILTALDSSAGLQMVGDRRLGLVVLDVDQSVRDGSEARAHISGLPDVPVVWLTGGGRWSDESRTWGTETNVSLHKPFSAPELIELAGQFLNCDERVNIARTPAGETGV